MNLVFYLTSISQMKIISDNQKEASSPNNNFKPWGLELNQYCMLMHLSQFVGYIFPLAGFILPIIMWTSFKDKNNTINEHGKNILNWMISVSIYSVIAIILVFLFIGFPLIIALGICSFLFTVLGALRASEGKIYKYPISIQFFK